MNSLAKDIILIAHFIALVWSTFEFLKMCIDDYYEISTSK
jgi:hypothetical protein